MNDRLNKYFLDKVDEYKFIELMPDYLKRMRIDFMRGVPIPLSNVDLEKLARDRQINADLFIWGMLRVIGINPEFEYVPKYVKLLTYMKEDVGSMAVHMGITLANTEALTDAALFFRAALVIDPEDRDALYNYMLVCRNLYSGSDDKEYVADFKQEVFETLLRLNELDPSIAMVQYYLGFAYINMGRYADARDAWIRFVSMAEPSEERAEVQSLLDSLEDPLRIEQGYRDIIEGRWEQGLPVLESYLDTEYREWWPLLYYLGMGYNRTGRYEEALAILKKAALANPSSPEIVAELVLANEALGDEINTEKYRRKLKILSTPPETRD